MAFMSGLGQSLGHWTNCHLAALPFSWPGLCPGLCMALALHAASVHLSTRSCAQLPHLLVRQVSPSRQRCTVCAMPTYMSPFTHPPTATCLTYFTPTPSYQPSFSTARPRTPTR